MNDTSSALFGAPIHVYTRAQAIADGVLVDVSDTARDAGFRVPVALTRAVWMDCVAWSDKDANNRGPGRDQYLPQDESGRLWDLLWMAGLSARREARCSSPRERFPFRLLRVPRRGGGLAPRAVTLHLHFGVGDDAEPVVTILQPDED